MSDPAFFAINYVAGTDKILRATLNVDPAGFSKLWFTIREQWADETIIDDASAIAQIVYPSGGIEIIDITDVQIVIPAGVTGIMLLRDYVADLRGKTVNGSRSLPLAMGTLTRLQHATVSRT